MRRFILIWFAVSGVFLAVVFLLGVVWTGPELALNTWRFYGTGLVTTMARGSVDAFEAGGLPALREFESRLAPEGRIQFFLFDDALRELHGRVVPAYVEVFLPRVEVSNGQIELIPAARGMLAGTQVSGRGGRTYRFLALVNARSVRGYTLNPGAWALRTGGFLLAVAAVCVWLALRLSSPLARLRAATRAFAGGQLSARADAAQFARQPPEFRELAHDFDEMAARIETLVTSQRQLLQDVSHELRTPLTRLNLATSLARTQTDSLPAALDRIDRESERLNELIGRILRLSRLESLGEPLRREPIALADFLETLVSDASFEAGALDRRVTLTVEGRIPVLAGDRELLREAIENLVRNAIRFTPAGGEIRVVLRPGSPGFVRILVHDAGPGVAPAHLGHIFEPFYRAPGMAQNGGTGFGLGLAIARRAVVLHGGELAGRNHPDGGFEVALELPTNGDNS